MQQADPADHRPVEPVGPDANHLALGGDALVLAVIGRDRGGDRTVLSEGCDGAAVVAFLVAFLFVRVFPMDFSRLSCGLAVSINVWWNCRYSKRTVKRQSAGFSGGRCAATTPGPRYCRKTRGFRPGFPLGNSFVKPLAAGLDERATKCRFPRNLRRWAGVPALAGFPRLKPELQHHANAPSRDRPGGVAG